MKVAIVYISTHHENTRKLVDAIKAAHEVETINGADREHIDLTGYDCVGFASGIAYSSFYPQMLKLMEHSLPEGKQVFFLYTCGSMRSAYTDSAAAIAAKKHCTVLGAYGCRGFDTFGPFKLIGGIAKGHPDEGQIQGAVTFFEQKVLQSGTT